VDRRQTEALNVKEVAEFAARDEYPKRPRSRAGLDSWKAQCREIDNRHDVPALRAAYEAMMDALETAEQAILAKPADSIVGVAAKLALWIHLDGEAALLEQTLDDAFEHRIAIQAYRDALRLGGLPERLGTRRYRVAAKLDMKPTGGRNG